MYNNYDSDILKSTLDEITITIHKFTDIKVSTNFKIFFIHLFIVFVEYGRY